MALEVTAWAFSIKSPHPHSAYASRQPSSINTFLKTEQHPSMTQASGMCNLTWGGGEIPHTKVSSQLEIGLCSWSIDWMGSKGDNPLLWMPPGSTSLCRSTKPGMMEYTMTLFQVQVWCPGIRAGSSAEAETRSRMATGIGTSSPSQASSQA